MTDVHVPAGASVELGRVEGDLKVGHNAKIRAADGRLVTVTGAAEFEGDSDVDCDLECASLRVERSGGLRVRRDLAVKGTIDVSNSIAVGGMMSAESVDVGGRLNAKSVSCRRMRVGGIAEISESLKADSIEVGGKLECRGTVDIRDLQVGGKARVGGGKITGTINVGGKFESSASLEFGELQVFGIGSLAAGSKGKRLVAAGKLDVRGDLQCDRIEIAGAASFAGDCSAASVDVKGKFDVAGSMTATERLEVYGAAAVEGSFSGESLRVSGKLSAERAVVTNDAEIMGSAETRKGLKARSIVIRSGTRCTGPLVGETVEIGGSGPSLSAFMWGQRLRVQAGTSQVGDVYATRLVVGPGSRTGRIFADMVDLGSGSDAEEVTYVHELKVADHVKIVRPVRKVDKLPDPPL